MTGARRNRDPYSTCLRSSSSKQLEKVARLVSQFFLKTPRGRYRAAESGWAAMSTGA
jgi:hypothetical protein